MTTLTRDQLARVYPRPARLLISFLLLLGIMLSFGQGPGGAAPAGQAPGAAAVPAARQAAHVAIITIKGEIVASTLDSVNRRLTLAERAGADAIVIELDTPGGDLSATLGISNAIKASPIKNTVAWVHPQAYSGGAIIALACREIVVSDPASLGDALVISPFFNIGDLPEHERQKISAPVVSDLVDSARRHGYDEVLVQGIAVTGVELWLVEHHKTGERLFVTRDEYRVLFGEEPPTSSPVLPSAPTAAPAAEQGEGQEEAKRALPQGLQRFGAGRRQRSGDGGTIPPPAENDPNRYIPAGPGMEAMAGEVTYGQEVPTQRPAITPQLRGQYRLVEYVSTGSGPFVFKTQEMLRYGMATQVVQNDEELRAFFGARQLLRLDQTWSEGLVALLTWLPVKAVLVVLFLLGLFIEMTNPGLVLPGTIAMLALLGLLGPPMLINMASWWEVAAIVAGIVFILIEIFVMPGFGFMGVIGLLLLFGGLVGTFVPSGAFFADSPRQRNDALYGITTLVLSIASAGVLMYFIVRNFGSIPILGRLVLKDGILVDQSEIEPMLAAMAPMAATVKTGMVGRSVTTLRPAGQIELDGSIVDVVSDMGYIGPGEAVRVTTVTPFRIGVERA